MGEPEYPLKKAAPVRIIAEILTLTAVIWIFVSIVGEEWVKVKFSYHGDETWTWGIGKTCNKVDPDLTICVQSDWITVCLVFTIISLILCLTALVCAFLGLVVPMFNRKQRLLFIIAACFMAVVAFLEFLVVIVFPIKFGEDISLSHLVRRWDFDWTYGFAWGGVIFSIGAVVFFLLPIKSENEMTTFYGAEYKMTRSRSDSG